MTLDPGSHDESCSPYADGCFGSRVLHAWLLNSKGWGLKGRVENEETRSDCRNAAAKGFLPRRSALPAGNRWRAQPETQKAKPPMRRSALQAEEVALFFGWRREKGERPPPPPS